MPKRELNNGIKALRKEAEQKFIGTLTRFYYRRVESNQIKLRRAKSHKLENDIISNANQERREEHPQSSADSANSLPDSIKANIQI